MADTAAGSDGEHLLDRAFLGERLKTLLEIRIREFPFRLEPVILIATVFLAPVQIKFTGSRPDVFGGQKRHWIIVFH